MPLQSKVLIFFSILLIIILFEWLFFSQHENNILKEEMLERGHVLARMLSQLSREPLISFRITTLEQQIDSILEEKDVIYSRIYDADYRVLAATDRDQEGWIYSGALVTDPEITFTEDMMIARSPVIVMDEILGMAEIVFSLETMKKKINEAMLIFVLIFVIELILAASFALFLQVQVVRPLDFLSRQVKKITPENLMYTVKKSKYSAEEIKNLWNSINDLREKLKNAQDEIISRTRLATLGQIAANLTHEIRNPLEAISGSVEILSLEKNLGDESMESLSIIQEEIENLNDYLSEFLEYAGTEPIHLTEANINTLIEDCIFLLNPVLKKKNIHLEYILDENLPVCNVNINQLKRVFINIVLNSAEAVNDRGNISVSSFHKNNSIIIIIKDNGSGIDEKNLPIAFDLYFTTKKNGSGIGLALCKKIVEQHNGTISLESTVNKGTAVTITLPLTEE